MKPIFLISLPRSGSTLLQRLISSHPEIVTRTEPWVLLPILYSLRQNGVFTEYGHRHSNLAMNEFLQSIPEGDQVFNRCLKKFIYDFYGSIGEKNEKYFLDKTPRYSLVAERLFDIFPDDRFLILWRNPLSVVASLLKTFRNGRFHFLGNTIDLYDGFERLHSAFCKNREKVFSLKYEDFVSDSANNLKLLCNYLDVQYEHAMFETFSDVRLPGTYGDKKGYSHFSTISEQSVASWKEVLNSPFRKRWCRRYLDWIGEERLADIGYSYDHLMEELDSVPSNFALSIPDAIYHSIDVALNYIEPYVLWRIAGKCRKKSGKAYFLS